MLSYRPPKSSCWGHAVRPKNTLQAIQKTYAFLEKYFEPIQADDLTLRLNSFRNDDPFLHRIQQQAAELFGPQGLADSMTWSLPPGGYPRVVHWILGIDPPPKHLRDPIRPSFNSNLSWKKSALPDGRRAAEHLLPEDKQAWRSLFIVDLELGGRISFPGGITIPISLAAPAAYQFLAQFSADAPFKMSAKNFQVVVGTGKNCNLITRKLSAEVLEQLQAAIE